jgi:hypothetical protein
MIPGISAVDISAAMKTLEAGDVIGKANQLLVEFLRTHPTLPLLGRWEVGLLGHDECGDLTASLECEARPAAQDTLDWNVHTRSQPMADHL